MDWPVQRPRKAEEDDYHYEQQKDFFQGDLEANESYSNGMDDPNAIRLDEVPFDRDVKWMNVPSGSRPRVSIAKNHLFMKHVHSIASDNSQEFESLDNHYKALDMKKKDFESKSSLPKKSRNHNKVEEMHHRRKQNSTARGSPIRNTDPKSAQTIISSSESDLNFRATPFVPTSKGANIPVSNLNAGAKPFNPQTI